MLFRSCEGRASCHWQAFNPLALCRGSIAGAQEAELRIKSGSVRSKSLCLRPHSNKTEVESPASRQRLPGQLLGHALEMRWRTPHTAEPPLWHATNSRPFGFLVSEDLAGAPRENLPAPFHPGCGTKSLEARVGIDD